MVQSVQVPTPQTTSDPRQKGGPPISFRHSTTERTQQLTSETAVALTAGTQTIERTVDGSGYIYGINLLVQAPSTSNLLNAAFTEDGPFDALDTVELRDTGADIAMLTGYALYLLNIANHDYAYRDAWQSANAALASAVSGSGPNGGTFNFALRVPVANNRREMIGALGNQDRAQQYFLKIILAAIATIYSTSPTTVPAVTISKHYESYTVPARQAANGQPQVQAPPWYGSIRQSTRTISEAVPTGGSQIPHFVRRIANTVRYHALVMRSNGSRITAAANLPTAINLQVGDEPIYSENVQYRQQRNFEIHGQVLPPGVLFYDNIHDFWPGAGGELGYDYWYTQIVQNMKYLISWPAGFGSTNNSLEFITDDMILRRPAAMAVAA